MSLNVCERQVKILNAITLVTKYVPVVAFKLLHKSDPVFLTGLQFYESNIHIYPLKPHKLKLTHCWVNAAPT